MRNIQVSSVAAVGVSCICYLFTAIVEMGKKKTQNSDLGRAIVRKQEKRAATKARWNTPDAQMAAAVGRHTASDAHCSNLMSVLDATDLEELMLNATLANQDFSAERYGRPVMSQSVVVVTPLDGKLDSTSASSRREERRKLDQMVLKIPRRPPWTTGTSYEELMNAENDAFLSWRRHIAQLEEEYALSVNAIPSTTLTPFEKNLQVWRQLWRVVERSDLILQIVDARNPLLYFCEDLVRYVTDEMHRSHMLVMNKADLLSPSMITQWKDYFDSKGIDVVFFSAFKASVGEKAHDKHILGTEELIARLESVPHTNEMLRDDGRVVIGLCGYPNVGKSSTINVLLETASRTGGPAIEPEESNIAGGNGIIEDSDGDDVNLARRNSVENSEIATTVDTTGSEPRTDIKQSVKRVAVSATPGKTKHFQTLALTSHVILCDCPGLVFPNFSSSKAELICAGVLSVDTLRGDYISAMALIASRIPAAIFEGVYGIRFSESSLSSRPVKGLFKDTSNAVSNDVSKERENSESPKHGLDEGDLGRAYYVSAETLLECHAKARGFMTDHGRPDGSRSARQILKDFVNGRLVYAHGPDGHGESGIGASVFAKKGTLVYERQEVRGAEAAVSNSSAVVANSTDGRSTGFEVLSSEEPKQTAPVMARVSGSKHVRGREFVRVQRPYYSSTNL